MWYTVITALFRCPSSINDLNEKSPRVCKPYLNVRTHVAPYVEPYYNQYAAPHVEKARPYVDKFNTQVYDPSIKLGYQSYQKYGAPRIDQARTFGLEKWEQILKPQIDATSTQAKQQYDSNLAPHVNKASAAAMPYYTSSRDTLFQVYSTRLLPAYVASRPYAEKSYSVAHHFTVDTGLPYAQSAWASTAIFFDRTIFPKLRILYGENVEPQLVRIGERLGRYRDGRKLKAAMEEDTSTSTVSSASSSISSAAASVVSEASSSTAPTTTAATPSSSVTPEQEAEKTREKIESDLKNWQDRFAKAADKGTEDLEERVNEITERQIDSQVKGVGDALVIQLEETSASEIAKVKKEILFLVKKFPEEYDEDDLGKASLSLSRQTRFAGVAVKDKAQALRSWRESFDKETEALVSAASGSTLDVIDNIRDLGLQEIGLRWAQMEGVTYKDWSKYNEVKKTFDEWRSKIEHVAQEHAGLKKAKKASADLESNGMATAEETAKELARLKEVGYWKLEAGDITDDFSTKRIPARAAAGAQKAKDQASSASEQIMGTPQGTIESAASAATEKASTVASSASSAVVGSEPGVADQASSKAAEAVDIAFDKAGEVSEQVIGTSTPAHQSMASKASEKGASDASAAGEAVSGSSTPLAEKASGAADSAASSASSVAREAPKKVYGGAMAQKVKEQKPILDDIINDDDDTTYSEKMQGMVNQAGDRYADITRAVSEALIKATTTQGTIESASSVADDQYSKALSAASSVLYGTEQGTAASMTNVASDRYAQAVSA